MLSHVWIEQQGWHEEQFAFPHCYTSKLMFHKQHLVANHCWKWNPGNGCILLISNFSLWCFEARGVFIPSENTCDFLASSAFLLWAIKCFHHNSFATVQQNSRLSFNQTYHLICRYLTTHLDPTPTVHRLH